jgi:hypothetical protein
MGVAGRELQPRLRVVRPVDERLSSFGLAEPPQEQPGESGEGDSRALDEHDDRGEALVGECREAPRPRRGGVRLVDRRPSPHEDVRENHREDVQHDHPYGPPPRSEPGRPGEGADHESPHEQAEHEEQDVLEGVDAFVRERGLVRRRKVPEPEVERPEGEDDNRRATSPKRRQPVPASAPEKSQRDEQRCEVADADVLEHVRREEALVAEPVERRELSCEHDRESDSDEHATCAHRALDARPATSAACFVSR